jgi:hypothetical protein
MRMLDQIAYVDGEGPGGTGLRSLAVAHMVSGIARSHGSIRIQFSIACGASAWWREAVALMGES